MCGEDYDEELSSSTIGSVQLIVESFCSLSDDQKSLSIDTNPFNFDADDYSDESGLKMIQTANSMLDLPDALFDRMIRTRAIDGVQSEEYGKIKVTWSYHPDNGLEVVYEKKD